MQGTVRRQRSRSKICYDCASNLPKVNTESCAKGMYGSSEEENLALPAARSAAALEWAGARDLPKAIPPHSSHAQPVAQGLVLAQIGLARGLKGHGPALEKTLDRHIGLQSETFCQRRPFVGLDHIDRGTRGRAT